jgi:hypothetical protein
MSPDALKNMMKKGLEAMVGAVETVMNGVSDGIAKERKEKEWEEIKREEQTRKMAERKWEIMKKNRKRNEERLKRLEDIAGRKDWENEVKKMGDRVDRERKEIGRGNEWLKENVEKLQESLDEEKRTRQDRIGK